MGVYFVELRGYPLYENFQILILAENEKHLALLSFQIALLRINFDQLLTSTLIKLFFSFVD